jgi:hypothetical protein
MFHLHHCRGLERSVIPAVACRCGGKCAAALSRLGSRDPFACASLDTSHALGEQRPAISGSQMDQTPQLQFLIFRKHRRFARSRTIKSGATGNKLFLHVLEKGRVQRLAPVLPRPMQ